MNDRLLSARRVLDVQVKLRRIAELKLAELQRQEQVLQAEEAELTRFLGSESLFVGVLSSSIVRQLRKNGQKLREIGQEKEKQEAKVLECAARVKLSERMIGVLDLEMRRSGEKRELGELIDQFLGRSGASFP
jgi:hypothetical protein